MLDDFLVRAALGGVGVSVAAGPLGSFVIWRRMAYFGDTTAHAAILGVALAFASGLPVYAGTVLAALAMAAALFALTRRGHAADTALGVLAHSALAAGIVAVSFLPGLRTDLSSFLFGDILAIGRADLIWIWGAALAVVALLVWRWQALLTVTVSEDLALSAGIEPKRETALLMLALALVVAVSIKIIGALLIGALLVVPAAAARSLSRSPETMAALATLLGAVAVGLGLWASLRFDTPAGPSIVVAAAVLFMGSLGAGRRVR